MPTLETGPALPPSRTAWPCPPLHDGSARLHGLDSPGRTPDHPHTMRRGPVAIPAEEGRRRNRIRPERRARVRAPCPEPEWPNDARSRQAGRHRARTGPEGHRAGPRDPNQAVVLLEEDRPPGPIGMLRGRNLPCRRRLRRLPKKPSAPPAAEPRSHRNETARQTTRALRRRTVPRPTHPRVNAEGVSRARIFRRQRRARRPYAAIGERSSLRHFRVPSSRYFAFMGAPTRIWAHARFSCA